MAWKGLESEELVQNLRQLVISFEPHIREAGSAEQAEDSLLHLEENDENFHRFEKIFDFVKLKAKTLTAAKNIFLCFGEKLGLTLYIRMDFPMQIDNKHSKDCPLYILRGHRSIFPNYDVLTSLKIVITLTNVADPGEMPHFSVSE